MKILDEKTPTAQTYKVDHLDERKILSTKRKVRAMIYGDREVMRNKKMTRFIDSVQARKKWVPAPS